MPYDDCIDCGEEFWREDDEDWKVRCYQCWREHKGISSRPSSKPFPQNEVYELRAQVRRLEAEKSELQHVESDMAHLFKYIGFLIFACHPDRVPGKEVMAHEVLIWLNDKRKQFGG